MSRTVPPGQLEHELLTRLAILDERIAARPARRNRDGRRTKRAARVGLFTLVMSALAIFAVAGVMAVHETGLFELDGDSVSHNAPAPFGPAEDWDDVSNGTDTAAVTTGIVPDEFGASTSDDQFTLGSKDVLDVSEWHWKSGVPPSDKTDLENAYAALYDDNGTQYLYLGADRFAVNGNAKLGFWIFQDHIGLNADGTFSGEHKVGDLLIESAFIQGGTNLGNINVWAWEGADGAAGHLSANPITVGADCRTTVDPNDFVCSINNNTEITVDWAYQGKKLGNDTPAPSHIFAGGFNETGVNLTHFFPNGIPCFSNILAETRAAGSSVSSSTEDFVLGTFETCGTVDGHKYLDVNGNGALDSGEPGLEGWTINLYESDGTTLIDSEVTDSDGNVSFGSEIEPGDYVVCEELQTDWTNTDPGGGTLCKSITVDIGETETVNFGNGAPAIDVTKEASATDVCSGSTVEYTYVVTNTGNVDLSNVTLSDDQLGTVGGPISLAAGDSETFTATSDPISGTVTNIVTATGSWDSLTPDASDTATVDVTAHDCTITVTKTPSETDVCNGSTVDYDYTVTNNSDEFDWTGDVIDDAGTPLDTSDDVVLANDATIAAGGHADYEQNGVAITGTVTNIVKADGAFNDPDATAASDTDTATVTGHDCGITLTKTVDDTDVCAGKTVTYSYVVHNDSDQFTWTGDITDDNGTPLDDTDDFTVASGVVVGPGADSTTYTHDSVIGLGEVTNTATADGTFDDANATAASDTDSATTEGHECSITVTKTPSQTNVCNGTAVDYAYTVTNNSDLFAWTGDVIDDAGTPADTSDDVVLANDVTIAAGDTLPLSQTGVVINGTVINIVTADGAFNDPDASTASDTATATVVGAPCGQGCTPGFWQGGFGVDLWNEIDDPDWADAGGEGTNPFVTTDLFSSGPWVDSGVSSVDSKTMLQIVGTGGGSNWARKAARDLVAAYLNASFLGSGYPYNTTTILSDWADAVAAGTSGFQAFHLKYAAANELGCPIGQSVVAVAGSATGSATGGSSLALLLLLIPFAGILLVIPGWGRRSRGSEA
jgi:hypothetical protein